ncbi:MAG: hypothetical protein ACI867_000979 [Glaciecola sp.]
MDPEFFGNPNLERPTMAEPSSSPQVSRRRMLQSGATGVAAVAAGATLPGIIAAAPKSAAAEPFRIARAWFTSLDEQRMLDGFDETHNRWEDGSIEVLLWPGDLARLTNTGLRFEITTEDLEATDRATRKASRGVSAVPRQPGETADGDYRMLADHNADMAKLAKKYPGKCRMFKLPYNSLEGREVYGVEIASNVANRDGRPVFYNDGIHHAREWPAAEVPIMWAYDLLENYGTDPRITSIVDNVRNIVVPVVNVDGYEFSRNAPIDSVDDTATSLALGVFGMQAYWRKNRRKLTSTGVNDPLSVSGANAAHSVPEGLDAYGIDGNRNYAAGWGGPGSEENILDQTHRGHEPFSEPMSRNVQWVMNRHHVTASISHHTSGDLILWAWGDRYDDAPDNDLLEGLGRAMAEYNGYKPQKSIQLYVTTGTASDYFYAAVGSISYTFEHAGSSFHPPYPETVPAMYAKNRDAMMLLAEECCIVPAKRTTKREVPAELTFWVGKDDLRHAVVKGRIVDAAGKGQGGAELTCFKRYRTKLWQKGDGDNLLNLDAWEEVFEANMVAAVDGTFEWHMNPSTQPEREFDGEVEYFDLFVTVPSSDGTAAKGAARRLHVVRGAVQDVGKLVVG